MQIDPIQDAGVDRLVDRIEDREAQLPATKNQNTEHDGQRIRPQRRQRKRTKTWFTVCSRPNRQEATEVPAMAAFACSGYTLVNNPR